MTEQLVFPEPKPYRVMGSDAAQAVGRFDPNGVNGYRASTMPDAPLRATRQEAVEDERAWREAARATTNTTTREEDAR